MAQKPPKAAEEPKAEAPKVEQAAKATGRLKKFAETVVNSLETLGLGALVVSWFAGERHPHQSAASQGASPEEGVTTRGTEAARKLYLNIEARFGPWHTHDDADKPLTHNQWQAYDSFLKKLSEAEASLWSDAMAEGKEDAHINKGGKKDNPKSPSNIPARFIIRRIAGHITGVSDAEAQQARIQELVDMIRHSRLTANFEDRTKEVLEKAREQASKIDTSAHKFFALWALGWDRKAWSQSILQNREVLAVERQIEEAKTPKERADLHEVLQDEINATAVAYQSAHPPQKRWSISDVIACVVIPTIIVGFLLTLAGAGKYAFAWFIINISIFMVAKRRRTSN